MKIIALVAPHLPGGWTRLTVGIVLVVTVFAGVGIKRLINRLEQ